MLHLFFLSVKMEKSHLLEMILFCFPDLHHPEAFPVNLMGFHHHKEGPGICFLYILMHLIITASTVSACWIWKGSWLYFFNKANASSLEISPIFLLLMFRPDAHSTPFFLIYWVLSYTYIPTFSMGIICFIFIPLFSWNAPRMLHAKSIWNFHFPLL